MEACEEFSENMELHADDIEYFYIESKRVTARREEEKDNLRKEIGALQGEKEELRREMLDLKAENLQLREKLVHMGEVMGSKKQVIAQLVQGGQGGPQILLEGLQGVQLEEGQVQFIRQQVLCSVGGMIGRYFVLQVVRELVKAQVVAEQAEEIPPTKVHLLCCPNCSAIFSCISSQMVMMRLVMI